MGFITIMCARTGDFVSTGIEVDEERFKAYPPTVSRIRCPSCGSEHAWSKGRAWLTDGSDRLVRGGHFGKDVVAQIPMSARSPQEVRDLNKAFEPPPTKPASVHTDRPANMRERITQVLLRL
jgi:hypothetical protein